MFRFLPRWRRRRPEDAPGAADRGALPEEFSPQSRHRQPGQGWACLWRHTGTRHCPGAGHTGTGHSPGTGHTGTGHSPGTGHTGTGHSPGTGHTGTGHSPGTGHTGTRHCPGAGHTGTRHCPGAGHTGRDAGIPGEAGAGPGCAQVNGKGPGSGGARQEQPQVGNSPRGTQALGKDFGDKPGVPRQASNGNEPREGTDRPRRRAPLPPRAGNREDEEGEPSGNSRSQERDTNKDSATHNGNEPREGTDRPRRRAPLPPRAGSREDEEGEPGSNSRSRDKDSGTALQNGNVPGEGMDQPACVPSVWTAKREDEEGEPGSNSRSRGTVTAAATTPGRDRRTEALSGAERREWLWQRLLQLGEDMANWEGKPTAELAAGLARRIAETPLCSYPEGPGGTRSARRERSSGASPDPDIPSGIYGSLLRMLRASGSAESAEEDPGSGSSSGSGSGLDSGSSSGSSSSLGWEQGSGASPDHISSGRYRNLLRMRGASGSTESAEEDSGWEQSSGASPDCDIPCGNCFIGMLRASGNAESSEEDSGLEQDQDQDQAAMNGVQAPSRLELRFPEVWARSRLDCGRVAEEVQLDGAPVPFQQQRPLRPDEEEQMAELLKEYQDQEIVVKGTSESNNPLILYQKPHGRGVRLSLDCRALNAATPVEPQERLDRDRLLTSINPRSRFFSVLDLSNACLAIPLASSCWHRFAFTFGDQQFLFTRLPPTFRGTASILHRRVAAMLSQLSPDTARGVFHYSDDILITAKRRRQLRFRTRRVLQLIQSTGFKVNREKTQLVQPEVNFLGLTLSAAGRRVPHERLNQICQHCDAPEPWHPDRLRSVLGEFNDLKEFIADYLELAMPLQALAVPEKWQGEREWKWQREWRQGGWEQLQRLKEALKAAPTLLFPNKSQPFVIRLSVHECSVGAVLLQEREGELLPVRHCSHRLRGQSWAPQDAACLAAARAVEAFQSLTGPAPILIQGPAGRYLLRGKPLLEGCTCDPELPERWRLLVTTKGLERQESQTAPIPLAPGLQEPRLVSIPLAPALWQLPADIPKANVWFLAVEKGSSGKQSVAFAAVNLEERWLLGLRQGCDKEAALLEALQELQEQHRSCHPLFLYSSWPLLAPRLKQLERSWRYSQGTVPAALRRLRSCPGMLQVRQVGWHGNVAPDESRWMQEVRARARAMAKNPVKSRKDWEPSAYERQEIVAQCHRRCHDGAQETLRRVQHVRSWTNAHEDVARWVRRCPRCQEGNPVPDPDPDPAPQRERGPWSRLWLSLCTGLLESPEGFRALLLVQDELSGWLDAFPLREPAQPEVCRVLLHEVFGRFGRVGTVLLKPKPAWLWHLLRRPPLLGWHGRLEPAEPAEGAAPGVARVAQALGKGWAAALPLIRAGFAAQWVREEELGALLCIPGLPLEVRCRNSDWKGECGGNGSGNGNGKENELLWLNAMEILEGYRQKVQEALW
ncbi:uncharacterized protein LOC132070711 [Ammospiza nelsoni]|uniref:uncharacterized protein LOC132070711 n=1 Tax=Ammospiza nelsoni TaxID=2857394 RepID=UPI00286BA1FC|nr:uncharacterized protein LOC132070711 [Ammospiza nelsoni]